MTDNVTLVGAFIAGLISFLSPCVLPLIPAYIAFISGKSIEELREGGGRSQQAITGTLFFILGFSVVFIILGASATQFGNFLLGRLEFF